MKKLVILDYTNQMTYVIPYDTNVYEDAIQCIQEYSKEHELFLIMSNLDYMEVDTFKLEVL